MSRLRKTFAEQLLGTSVNPTYYSDRLSQKKAAPPFSRPEAGGIRKTSVIRGTTPPGVKTVRSACFSCNTTCEVLVFVDEKSGRVLKVEGDPDSPVTRGVLCAKGLAARDLVENPARLLSPLKRIGKRGQGQWQPISSG